MRDKIVAQRAYYGVRSRPLADLQPFSAMLRCGPSDRTFAARAKFDDGRTHSVRTNRTCAAAANAHAEIARMPSITRLLTQHVSPNRTFKQVEPG
jgi:hypothetical protein